jgi:hypothetical protein
MLTCSIVLRTGDTGNALAAEMKTSCEKKYESGFLNPNRAQKTSEKAIPLTPRELEITK